MMPQPCCKCHERPRMVSRSGKTLTMCESCQRQYWREKKRQANGYKPRRQRKPKSPPESEARETVEVIELQRGWRRIKVGNSSLIVTKSEYEALKKAL